MSSTDQNSATTGAGLNIEKPKTEKQLAKEAKQREKEEKYKLKLEKQKQLKGYKI